MKTYAPFGGQERLLAAGQVRDAGGTCLWVSTTPEAHEGPWTSTRRIVIG